MIGRSVKATRVSDPLALARSFGTLGTLHTPSSPLLTLPTATLRASVDSGSHIAGATGATGATGAGPCGRAGGTRGWSSSACRCASGPEPGDICTSRDICLGSSFDRKEYDVVIVGGGAMGCSSAYWLAQHYGESKRIAVVEPDPRYKIASTPRSVGGIRQQFSNLENVELSLSSVQFMRDIAKHLGDAPGNEMLSECGVNLTEEGYLMLATPEGTDILRENHAVQQQAGADTELIGVEDLSKRFPWLRVDDLALGCYGVSGEGFFDPWTLLLAFKRKAMSLGVDFIQGRASGFHKNHAGCIESVAVENDEGDSAHLDCETVVNTSGAWSGHIARMAGVEDLPMEARRRCVFVVHHKDLHVRPCPLVVDPLTGVYFRPEGGNGLYLAGVSPPAEIDPDCSGSDHKLEVTNEDYDNLFYDIIWPALAHRVPAFESLGIQSSWVGYYDYNTFDQNALIGYHPHVPNMVFATGFSGHGIQQAPAVGRAVMELIGHGSWQTINLDNFALDRYLRNAPAGERNVV